MTFEKPFNRITAEPDKMGGRPSIRGYRFTVQISWSTWLPIPTEPLST